VYIHSHAFTKYVFGYDLKALRWPLHSLLPAAIYFVYHWLRSEARYFAVCVSDILYLFSTSDFTV